MIACDVSPFAMFSTIVITLTIDMVLIKLSELLALLCIHSFIGLEAHVICDYYFLASVDALLSDLLHAGD